MPFFYFRKHYKTNKTSLKEIIKNVRNIQDMSKYNYLPCIKKIK